MLEDPAKLNFEKKNVLIRYLSPTVASLSRTPPSSSSPKAELLLRVVCAVGNDARFSLSLPKSPCFGFLLAILLILLMLLMLLACFCNSPKLIHKRIGKRLFANLVTAAGLFGALHGTWRFRKKLIAFFTWSLLVHRFGVCLKGVLRFCFAK